MTRAQRLCGSKKPSRSARGRGRGWLALLGLSTWLAACGPLYRTEYRYLPPADPAARGCVLQCQLLRGQCEQFQAIEYERCQDRADRDYYWCERNRRYVTTSDGQRRCVYNCSCARAYCGRRDHACESSHRDCYGACGGVIQEERVCVFNCP